MTPLSGDHPPVSAAWREVDPVGHRQFADLGPLTCELGGSLPSVRVAYETWGQLAPDSSNAILILHALTGDSHVVGPADAGHPTAGWWQDSIGPGAALDTDRWFVVAPNVLGGCQGSTGPSSLHPDGRAYGSRFPRVTVADQVEVEARLADLLGIHQWAAVIGGSMGAMRALEWLVGRPERVARGLVVAVGACATGDQIGTQTTQIRAITDDPHYNGGDYYDADEGPWRGMALARRIAHLTYRTEQELAVRFGSDAQDGEDPLGDGRYAVQSYLDHQADKLAVRFDAGTYVSLTDVMTTWDLGRGRGGTARALATITAPVIVAGIDSDRLYPLYLQRELAEGISTTVGDLRIITSDFGHDAFLVEREQVFPLVRELLAIDEGRAPLARPEQDLTNSALHRVATGERRVDAAQFLYEQ